MSLRTSAPPSPRACSGAMYAGVPTTAPVLVRRTSFEAATPDGAPAGAIDCNPRCAVVPPGTIRRSVAPPFPCAFVDALAAARRAGLTATQPLITYGYWSEQGRAGWTFQASAGAAIIEVGAGCAVAP